jgi:hypothetical protein
MADNDVDLGIYAGTFSVYQTRIAKSHAFEEALAHAAAFLSKVACLFDRDIEKPFYDQVEYLWATFPSHLKTLEKYQGLMEVLLGQAVDFFWYADWPHYRTARDVKADKSLHSFKRFRSDFDVRFAYVQYYDHVLMRVPNSLRLRYRRLTNHPGRFTQGLTTTRCPKAMAGFINQLSEETARQNDVDDSFRVLINSVLRTVEYQNSLAKIGYVAPRNSAHLAGYAVDVEQQWYKEHDQRVHKLIESLLDDLYDKRVINLIRERTHWHVCLSPDHIAHYEALAQKWERKKP